MSNLIHIDKEYKAWIESLVVLYRQQQVKAAVKVNEEVIRFYWALGKDISEKAYDNRYGSHFYENVSQDLRSEMGNTQGLSESNIRYAKRFYDLYFGLCANLQQLLKNLVSRIFSSLLKYSIASCRYLGHTTFITKSKHDKRKTKSN